MRTYSDLDLRFTPHPITKDLVPKYDAEAIKNSIRNLIVTMRGERPFAPELGSNLNQVLFEPITPFIQGIIQREVINALSSYEPRATISSVAVNYYPTANVVDVQVEFMINGSAVTHKTNVVLERTR